MAWLCVLALPVANSAVLNKEYLTLPVLVSLCVKMGQEWYMPDRTVSKLMWGNNIKYCEHFQILTSPTEVVSDLIFLYPHKALSLAAACSRPLLLGALRPSVPLHALQPTQSLSLAP